MEPNWGGFYNYYPQDPNRSFDRNQPPVSSDASTSPHEEQGPRRAGMIQSPFLPPPPPLPLGHSGHPPMGLPPFSQSFYPSGYHPSQSPPQGANLGLATSFGGSSSAPPFGGGFHGPPAPGSTVGSTSPNPPSGSMASLSRALPANPRGMHSYSESPRLAPGPLSYSSSPGMHHLSPTSPTTHLIPPNVFNGHSSSNSSVFPQTALRTPSSTKRKGRQPGSPSGSGESWDESDRSGKPVIGEETEEQPWGMPQDQYKALNPRDKKQVRNRIGARRFRAKRKDYVGNLESSLRSRDEEVSSLRAQVDTYRAQVNDLRSRLGMPLLSPQVSNSSSTPGLGLLVSHSGSDGWADVKDD